MRKGFAVHAVFCDDIRPEPDGKVTLVGMHMQGVRVNGVAPCALPQIFLGVWVTYPTSPAPEAIRIVAMGDTLENAAFDTTLHPRQEAVAGDGDSDIAVEFITNRWAPAFFKGDGKLTVEIFADGTEIFASEWPVIVTPSTHPEVPPAIKLLP